VLYTDQLENEVRVIGQELGVKEFVMQVHPMVEAYLTKGWWNNLKKSWQKKYDVKIKLEASTSSELLQSKYFSTKGEEIVLG
jgi:ribonuclease G